MYECMHGNMDWKRGWNCLEIVALFVFLISCPVLFSYYLQHFEPGSCYLYAQLFQGAGGVWYLLRNPHHCMVNSVGYVEATCSGKHPSNIIEHKILAVVWRRTEFPGIYAIIMKCLTRNVKPWFCSISSWAKYMLDFDLIWMSNQYGRNSPEPSVFWAGQEVVINLVVKHPLSNLEVGSLRKPVNLIRWGYQKICLLHLHQGMPRSSMVLPLGSPDPILLSLLLWRFCLPNRGRGWGSPWVIPSAIACCSISRIKIDKWFPHGSLKKQNGYGSKLKAGSTDSVHVQYQGSNFWDIYLILTEDQRGNHYSKGSICNRTSSPPCLITNSFMAPTVWSCQEFKNPKPSTCCPKLGYPKIHWFTLHLG